MSLSQQEFTNVGRTMLGNAQAGQTLTISRIVVGDGTATQPSDLWPLTQLIDLKLNVTISAMNDNGDGTMLIEGSFLSSAAPSAFYLRELGVMAHVGTNADQLYSVSNVFSDPPDYIDPAAPTIQAFKILLVITRIPTGNVIVQIGPTDAVMGQNVGSDATGPGVFKDAVGNLLEFKRLVAGPNITLTEDPNHDTITIAATITSFQLTQNLDLYVPMSYPAPPGTPPSAFFPTIQAAHDYLLQFHIPAAYFATIHVWKGSPVLSLTTPTVFNHPDAQQIVVLGQDPVVLAVSGAITRAGTLPNIDLTIPVNTTGMSVNDLVYLFNAPDASMEGCGYVEQIISGASLKVRMIVYNNLPPASITALATTKLFWFPTQIATSVPSGQNAFLFNTGLSKFKNFALKSGGTNTNALTSLQNITLENCLAVGYQSYGYVIGFASMVMNPIVATNGCGVGLAIMPFSAAHAGPPDALADRVCFGGNSGYGIWCNGGSYYAAGTFTYVCSNQSSGVRADDGYFLSGEAANPGHGIVVAWNAIGLDAVVTGVILTALQSINAVRSNATWDCRSMQGGQIQVLHNVNTTGNYSPPLGTLGPDGGYITVSSP